MERLRHAGIARFFRESVGAGEVLLDGPAVQHARARRLVAGDSVELLDGRGTRGRGAVLAVDKRTLVVSVQHVIREAAPSALELLVPVADKERMLLAAEKCVELQVTAWRPVTYARSLSVSPRGEGDKFRDKVLARMRGALEQSGSAWLPALFPEADLADAQAGLVGAMRRFVLDVSGTPLASRIRPGPVALAVGPEGGFEERELLVFDEGGWQRASIGTTILRFETAVIAGAAVVRAAQTPSESA